LFVWLSLGYGAIVCAQDVLDNIPRDAAGVLVIRNFEALHEKVGQLSAPAIGGVVQSVFNLLTATVDRGQGLDRRGQFMLVALADDGRLVDSPLCLWLPVRDYGRFVRGLGGNPDDRISVVTLLGEDLLCARHAEKWALLMDPDARPRMEQMLSTRADPPPRLAAWREWLTGREVALAVLPKPSSRKAIREWASSEPAAATDGPAGRPNQLDSILGSGRPDVRDDADFLTSLRRSAQRALTTSPQLVSLALDAEALAIGAQIDDSGNLVAGLRLAWLQGDSRLTKSEIGSQPPRLHREAEFTVSGAGWVPGQLARAFAESMVWHSIIQFRREFPRNTFDVDAVKQFARAAEDAAAEVVGVSVFHTPGGEHDGVYTNQVMAVRVTSAESFVNRVEAAARLWNQLNETATPNPKSSFQVERITVEGRPAIQYTLDIVASEGLPNEPTMRVLMERLFGPDRKMHRLVVPVDAQTVILADATASQAAAAVKALVGAPANWDAANVAVTNRLLPAQADWRLFASPATYTKWVKRTNLVTQGDAIGAVPVEQFPATPPIGAAGGFAGGAMWIDVVVPAHTLRAGAAYLQRRAENKAQRQ
jgi:hypothetical protein